MKSQLAEDRIGVCAVSFRDDNQWPSGVVDHSDVIEHPDPTMVRSSTATAAIPKRASPQLQT
jgi:hypothetical protein